MTTFAFSKTHMAQIAVAIGVFTAMATPGALQAQEWNLQAVTTMKGDCTMQVKEASACKGAVMWTEFKNGRSTLAFYNGKRSYSLSGENVDQTGDGAYVQPVDTMRVFDGDRLVEADEEMKGQCRFELKAKRITCEVASKGKNAQFAFALGNVHDISRSDF